MNEKMEGIRNEVNIRDRQYMKDYDITQFQKINWNTSYDSEK